MTPLGHTTGGDRPAIADSATPRADRSTHGSHRDYYTPRPRDRIGELFKADEDAFHNDVLNFESPRSHGAEVHTRNRAA